MQLFSRIDPKFSTEQESKAEDNLQNPNQESTAKRLFTKVNPESYMEQGAKEADEVKSRRAFTRIDPLDEAGYTLKSLNRLCEEDGWSAFPEHLRWKAENDIQEEGSKSKSEEKEGEVVSKPDEPVTPKEKETGTIPKSDESVAAKEKMVTAATGQAAILSEGSERNFELELVEIISHRSETPEGETEQLFYKFWILIGQNTFETKINVATVADFQWVKIASRGRAYFHRKGGGEYFDQYVSRIISRKCPPLRVVYASNGWKKTDRGYAYVYDKGAIGSMIEKTSGDPGHKFEFSYKKVGTYETFHQALGMLEICQDKKITLSLFLFTHIGVLETFFDQAGFPVKFVLAVIGETNSRKTSLTLCLTKIFNRKDIQKPEVTFASTEGGIEKCIGLHADAPLVIDDFMPAATWGKQRQLDTKLEKVIRLYGDRKGIERMTDFAKNPGAGYYPVRGVGIITGELFRGVQSSLSRCLIINIDRGSVDNGRLEFYQTNYKILGTHAYDFINFAAETYENIVEFIGRKIPEYRALNLFELPRHNEIYATLMTAAEIVLLYAGTRGFLGYSEQSCLLSSWQNMIFDLIKRNAAELSKQNWSYVFAEVCNTIAEEGTNALPKQEEKKYADMVFEDAEYYFIQGDNFLARLRKILDVWGIDFPGFSKREIFKIMENSCLLETKGRAEGKSTQRLPGAKINRQRFMYIKKPKLRQFFVKRKIRGRV